MAGAVKGALCGGRLSPSPLFLSPTKGWGALAAATQPRGCAGALQWLLPSTAPHRGTTSSQCWAPGVGPASMRPLLGRAGGGGSCSGFSMLLLLKLIKVETEAEGTERSWGWGQQGGHGPLFPRDTAP